MAQPQPQRTFSPSAQMTTPSPGAHTASFPAQPPQKKPRLSPAPSPQSLSQPGPMFSPLAPNSGSPATPGTPNSMASPTTTPANATQQHAPSFPLPSSVSPSAAASPVMPSAPPAVTLPGGYNTSFTNGNGTTTPTIPMPAGPPAGQVFSPKLQSNPATPTGPPTPSGPPFPHIAPAPTHPTTGANVFTPIVASPAVQTPTGVMGPPSKPADRPTKEYQYDVDDSLAGTGIDLRQEEQFQADYFAGTFRPEARTGFPANTPGRRSSFYGSLVANQPATPLEDESQKKASAEAAKHAWGESAKALATSRGNAIRSRFLEFNSLHARLDKISREHGISVNVDYKSVPTSLGRTRQDTEFPKPQVTVKTAVGPDGAIVSTTGTFLPEDTFLADQIALLSLATRHRLRELLEDANKVASVRQQTSHGIVPEEWADAAAPLPPPGAATVSNGDEASAGDSGTNPLKRPLETENPATAATTAETVKKISTMNTLVKSLREVGKEERDLEEMRLRKRQKREGKLTDAPSTPTGGRAGTPATPGSTAPESEKQPTKKELKKNAAAKAAEQNDTLSANRTSMAFLGGRKKQYSWMSGGASKRAGLGGGGNAGGGGAGGSGAAATGGANVAGNRRPGEPVRLTGDGRTKLGAWREDTQKGKDIQLRDWVVVLESDGRETSALQDAYNRLDGPTASRTM